MTPTPRQYLRRPGSDGEWIPHGDGARSPKGARGWAVGWDRETSCPRDPMKRRAGSRTFGRAPEGGKCRGSQWRETWEDSRRVVRTMRRAGYVARWRWDKGPGGERRIGKHVLQLDRYLQDHDAHLVNHPDPRIRQIAADNAAAAGPVAGLIAVDPWKTAEAIRLCSSAWYRQLKWKPGNLATMKAPRRCGRRHSCPVCARQHSTALAGALRDVITDRLEAGDLGSLALVTVTQRADYEEPLSHALERLRSGWKRLTRGRPGRRFKALVRSWYFGLEVTRTWAGKSEPGNPAPRPPESGQGWHIHAHIVLELTPGTDESAARAEIGALWQQASENASADAGLSGFGWDPVAGGCQPTNPDPWIGPWWVPIDPSDPRQVFQACKYPTPLADLEPVGMAEWLAVAFGRRWHQGGGEWRSVVKDAKELARDHTSSTIDPITDEEIRAPDFGETVSGAAPDDAPSAEPHEGRFAQWRLKWTDLEKVPEDLAEAIRAAGGVIHTRRWSRDPAEEKQLVLVRLPAEWSERSLAETERDFAAFDVLRETHRRVRDALKGPDPLTC